MITIATSTLLPTILAVAVSNVTGTPCDLLTLDKNIFCLKQEQKYSIKRIDKDYEKIIQEIDSYELLKDNWDGYGAIKPSHSVIEMTKKFIRVLEFHNISKPKIMLSGDNEIALFWKNKKDYVEASIDDSNKLTYFYRLSGKIYGEDDLPISDVMPQNFAEALASFFVKTDTTTTIKNLINNKSKKLVHFAHANSTTDDYFALAV